MGVDLHYDAPVRSVRCEGGVARGVDLDGRAVAADVVVANADVAHLAADLLAPGQLRLRRAQASLSGWTAVVKARRVAGRAAHTVVFPEDYREEFVDMFDRDRPPRDPAVYLCAQDVAHARAAWPDHQPVFLMANAPAGCTDVAALADAALSRARASGLIAADDAVLWSRTPMELAERFPGSQGSLYGAASNDAFAAFARPHNRAPGVRGLYLASGSAHPGGGMPLCARSGLMAAELAMADFGSAPRALGGPS